MWSDDVGGGAELKRTGARESGGVDELWMGGWMVVAVDGGQYMYRQRRKGGGIAQPTFLSVDPPAPNLTFWAAEGMVACM